MDRRRTEWQVGPVVAGGPGALGEERHAQRVLDVADGPATRGRSTPDATSTPTAGMARSGAGHIRRIEPAGQDDRQLARDCRGQPLGGAGSGAARVRPAGGVEEEALDTAGEVGMATRHDLAGDAGRIAAGSPAGRWRTFQVRRPIAPRRLERLAAVELDDVGIESRIDGGKVRGRGVDGDRDHERAAIRRRRRPDQPRQVGGLVEPQLAGRAGGDVEPDRVRTGGDRGQHPVLVGDAADLDERPAGDVREVIGRPAGGDEGRGRGRRLGRANERLADERTIESQRPPAGDRGRLADSRLGDDQPVVRHQLAKPRCTVHVDLERPQVAVVEPDEARPESSARSSSRGSWTSTSGSIPSSRVAATSRARRRAGWRTARSRTRSAPAARRTGSWRASTTNSLARTGMPTAARTARRSSTDPPNQCGSHRTEIAVAPPAS